MEKRQVGGTGLMIDFLGLGGATLGGAFTELVDRQANELTQVAKLKWPCFLGQVCGLAKMHLVCVHSAFRVSALPKSAMSGVRLSRAVLGRSEL